ncbi:MAG: four helix bundle protein, partial [Desulfobacteraceae bacterium]|nr:four helix bundle protein [Desulfobacteraceae bacterium]
MDNKDFGKQLERRTQTFAVRIIHLSTKLTNTEEARVIRNQITKSGTSIGANYREANRARSKADFKNKIRICESEASETQYWIEVTKETKWLPWEY